ncbi:DNA polymerase Y family protein [Notoacmeibacter sp. MSK16QG-6]|uniref:Y-family DNA polymerase n=1 Tax=Notoacmeibacter sp. MSK16QG-6 TaxID=2957982 RepID=UPI00209E7DF6|nr:DNA polymerase Y family protein [Notoacmeibacter sp. MSK16QG-6]MCP1200297.1 DNA polymerase Y family protein [Notoacmeibacter sp. MSK16QG-6]
MTMRRIVSIWFPRFPMERWTKLRQRQRNALPPEGPLALIADGPKGPVIHDLNEAAREAGIRRGARAVDMRALCPALHFEQADPAGDKVALEKLALWARRWCPWSIAEGRSGLLLDTTGSDHLWGGEAAMLADMEARFKMLGYGCRLAIAPTIGAAHAFSYYGESHTLCTDPAADLAPLPVASLRLEPDTILLLHRLGLRRIGDLMAVPRLHLTRRFSRSELAANPLLRLDQALGRTDEPLDAPEEALPFHAQKSLAEPIVDPMNHLPDLFRQLCALLQEAGHGARRVRLTVYRTDGEIGRIEAATAAPTRDPAHMASLFRERVEHLDPGFGFDVIALEALAAHTMNTVQTDLTAPSDDSLDLPRLIDRLTNRFGDATIYCPLPYESHVPERARRNAPPLAKKPKDEMSEPFAAQRPLRLLDPAEEVRVLYAVPEGPPAQFVWRRRPHRIARHQGPERIAPEWWRDRAGTRLRDYYRVEDTTGRRFWLYREGLHGDGRGGEPRWFLHGLFA